MPTVQIAFPVPSVRKAVTIKDSWLWAHVGNVATARAYSFCYKPIFNAAHEIVGYSYAAHIHGGNDIGAPLGAPIVAPRSGRVHRLSFGVAFGLHQCVLVDDDDAKPPWFLAHARRYTVADGAHVKAAQEILEVGNESYYVKDGALHSYGIPSHLHIAELVHSNDGRRTRNPHPQLLQAQAA